MAISFVTSKRLEIGDLANISLRTINRGDALVILAFAALSARNVSPCSPSY